MTKTIRTLILLTPLLGLSCYEPGASTIHGLPCTLEEACEGIYTCHQGFCLEEGETVLDSCRDGVQQKAEFCYFTDERITVEIPPAFDRWSGVGDFNGDGRVDFAVMDDREVTTAVFQGGGYDRTTVFRQPEPDTGQIHGMSVGDANGDGNSDIIVLTEGVDFFVQIDAYLGDGTGHAFNKIESNVFVEGEVTPAIMGDFTGDGLPDAFFTDKDEGLKGWLAPGMGGGGFGPGEEITAGTFSGDRPQVQDFNNDGVMDFLYVQRDNDLIAIMLAVPFTPAMIQWDPALAIQLNTDPQPNEVVVNDVNADGILDLVVSHEGSNKADPLHGQRGAGRDLPRRRPHRVRRHRGQRRGDRGPRRRRRDGPRVRGAEPQPVLAVMGLPRLGYADRGRAAQGGAAAADAHQRRHGPGLPRLRGPRRPRLQGPHLPGEPLTWGGGGPA